MIIVLLVLLFFGAIFLTIQLVKRRRNKVCTCAGLPCDTLNDCGEMCCSADRNEKCMNGTCCSSDCSGLRCGQVNGCGESCEPSICAPNQVCVGKDEDSYCCTPYCNTPCSTDGCGDICGCPNEGEVCRNGECCSSDPCKTGICDIEKCGVKCMCNNDYCEGSCCRDGMCEYNNICSLPNKELQSQINNTWARFCRLNDKKEPKCSNCRLVNPKFEVVDGAMSSAPISGKIVCDSCDDKPDQTIDIEKDIQYYDVENGKLVAGPRDDKYCATQPKGCSDCTCLNDADCTRWGCSKCAGKKCT
jgi:hypothetical protein